MKRWIALLVLTACSSASAPLPTPGAQQYVAGQSYFGKNNYIEYIAGNTPIILTAPHGGALLPATIPDRVAASCGGSATTVTDLNTAELVRAMQDRWFARYGKYPHVIVNHLARRKLDPNRTIQEATCGNAEAIEAYGEWHTFVDIAKTAAVNGAGKAWYMDMHGHGHTNQRLELGYLLSSEQLDLSDAALDANGAFQDTASIRTVSQVSPLSFSALLRGPNSLGTLYVENGFPSIPSSGDPRPAGEPYFSGGDNTRRHSCGAEATSYGGVTGGNVCGVQIESNFTGVRDNAASRSRFGDATAIVLERYLRTHWAMTF